MPAGNRKILIVEDEDRLARALEFKLNREGFETKIAFNGEEALEALGKEKYNLILLDIIMPKMDGMTLLKKIREFEWGRDLPIIILTNLSEAEKVYEATLNKVSDFLIKSDWSLDDVVKKVKEKIGMSLT